MARTLAFLAAQLGMTLQGEDREFTGLNTLEDATETEVSFLANPKYTHFLALTKACAVIVSADVANQVPSAALVSENPYFDFARAGALFIPKQGDFSGISEHASVHSSVVFGEGCTVHAQAHIGAGTRIGAHTKIFPGVYIGEDCVIGANCTLYPNAVIMSGITLGDNCTLNPGAVLGTDGFGFVRIAGSMQKIPQIGTVVLEDGVDVGANSCIDRSTLGATKIGKDTKIDNLVQVGHNVSIGEQCLLISQVGIAGSTKVGDRVTMAGQAGIAGHISIGDDVTVGPQAGVPKDIPSGVTGSGSPFMEGRTFMRTAVLIPKIPEMNRRIQQLEKELAAMKELLAQYTDKETS